MRVYGCDYRPAFSTLFRYMRVPVHTPLRGFYRDGVMMQM